MSEMGDSLNGAISGPGRRRIEKLTEGFKKDCELRKFTTARIYAQTAQRFVLWLLERGKSPEEVTKADLKDYLIYLRDDRKNRFETIRHAFIVINCFYSFIEEEEMIAGNPIPAFMKRYLQTYKDNGAETRQLINVEQAAKLAGSALGVRDQAIILLFLKTGMRRGEMLRLDVSDINMVEMSLLLKETAKRSNRLLFFDSETGNALSAWLATRGRRKGHEGPALFLSNEGTRLSKNQLQRIVTKHAQMVGLHDPESPKLADRFGPHCCRHWFTTHLRRAGMPREFIKELRGDSRREAKDIYDHIDKEELRRSYLACIPQLGI